MITWLPEWYSRNKLDGVTRHLILSERGEPLHFRTRAACAAFIKEKYGYIAKSPDLRREPHGWRVPKPVRVRIVKCRPLKAK